MAEQSIQEDSDQEATTTEESVPDEERCSNCGAVITDNYCSYCGQERKDRIVPLREMAQDVISNFITLDARIFRTLTPLLVKPGGLTEAYIEGQRRKYTRPSRLYLAVSIIFFFVLSLTSGGSISNFSFAEGAAASDTLQTPVDSLYQQVGEALSVSFAPPIEVDVDDQSIEVENDATEAELLLTREGEGTEGKIITLFVDNLPKTMFVMLPLFALLLKLLYIRRQRYYIEHLVFSLHYHAFIFIVLLVMTLGIELLPVTWSTFLSMGLVMTLPIYLYKAMHRVYGQSWGKTALKFVFLSGGYFIVLIIGTVLNAILVVWEAGWMNT